jgi:mRNA-degrading endonuclease RelE of RelBE toxin-antitoxin system
MVPLEGMFLLTTLAAYMALGCMIFVELTPFATFRERVWSDEDFAELQEFLSLAPAAGVLIPGSGGLRKVRWLAQQRGKRGGARVIYYWSARANRIYLVHGYTKSSRDDLTKRELTTLRGLLRDLMDG